MRPTGRATQAISVQRADTSRKLAGMTQLLTTPFQPAAAEKVAAAWNPAVSAQPDFPSQHGKLRPACQRTTFATCQTFPWRLRPTMTAIFSAPAEAAPAESRTQSPATPLSAALRLQPQYLPASSFC